MDNILASKNASVEDPAEDSADESDEDCDGDCILCKGEIVGYGGFGHNPYPLSTTGRCCDACNIKVIHARFTAALPATQ